MLPLLNGVMPVVPTVFDDGEALDLGGQGRDVDYLVDAGVDATCILAKYSRPPSEPVRTQFLDPARRICPFILGWAA